jgi:hypothetical protein
VAVTANGAAEEAGVLLNNNQPNKTPASPMQVMKIIVRFIFMQASIHDQIILWAASPLIKLSDKNF